MTQSVKIDEKKFWQENFPTKIREPRLSRQNLFSPVAGSKLDLRKKKNSHFVFGASVVDSINSKVSEE